jgi:exopolysaccharide biosynthesis predicted pyruvyltransferase EpsI/nitroreductase
LHHLSSIYWIGCFPPEVHSIGDHAQTLAVEKCFSDYKVLRYYRNQLQDFYSQKIEADDLIFIHSSGDFGDLYPDWHNTRKQIIAKYPNNRIVQLPVSVHYKNPANFEKDKIFFSDKTNVTICCRTRQAARLLAGNFNCKVTFFPDFAFYLKPKKHLVGRTRTLFVLRDDLESSLLYRSKNLVRKLRKPLKVAGYITGKNLFNYAKKLDYNFISDYITSKISDSVVYDAQTSDVDITDNNREDIVMSTIYYYSSFKLVVTDRFHACVFSYLTDTPFKTIQAAIGQKTKIERNLDYNHYFFNFRKIITEEKQAAPREIKNSFTDKDILPLIKDRRSIRKWSNKQIEPDKLNKILTAGIYAPSAANTQATKLKVITEKHSINTLCNNTSEWFRHNTPAAVILVFYDKAEAKTLDFTSSSWHTRFIWQDTACAMTNMMIEAESLGLKTCWGSINPDQTSRLKNIFNFKDSYILTCMLLLGYGEQQVNYDTAIHQGKPIKRNIFKQII